MPQIDLHHLKYVKTKQRKKAAPARYVQVSRAGRSIRLQTSPEDGLNYFSEYKDALHTLQTEHAPVDSRSQPNEHKVKALVKAFQEAGPLDGLRPATLRNYKYAFETVLKGFGEVRFKDISSADLINYMDTLPDYTANVFLQVLRRIIIWAGRRGYVSTNPTIGLTGTAKSKTGFPEWSEPQILKYCQTHGVGTHARLCLDLLLYTGMRVGDIIELGPDHVKDSFLSKICRKNGQEVEIPFHPDLKNSIEASETGIETFLALRRSGNPYKDSKAFGDVFRLFCKQAGINSNQADKAVSGHGLRKAVAVRSLGNGATTTQVMALQGWGTTAMVDHYGRRIDRKQEGRRNGYLMFNAPPEPAPSGSG